MAPGSKTIGEIYNQPEAWTRCLETLDTLDLDRVVGDKDPRAHPWLLVGCGTSFHLADAAAYMVRALTGAPARAVPASEILFNPELEVPSGSAIFPVLISRSGHTSEVLQVAELLRQRHLEFLAVTCDANELAQLSRRTIHIPIAEESIVMTSSFTSMLLALQYVAARFARNANFIEALRRLPSALSGLLPVYADQVEDFTSTPIEDAAFLAQGALYPIAREMALKVMESSSSYAQFFHTLEFRHGPKSIVSENVLVGALLSEKSYKEESLVVLEMKELGGRILTIANHITPEVKRCSDLAIELDVPVPELALSIVYLVWGQLLGVRFGLRKGLNPDSPRNLSRVVTLDPVL